MDRIPEPELMDDEEQAAAYAEADFSEANGLFVELFQTNLPDGPLGGPVLDLGCGPADIPLRLAKLHPTVHVDAVDGSRAMLLHARKAWQAAGMRHRITLVEGRLPLHSLPVDHYAAVLSNSLLHHLSRPAVLWQAIAACARQGAPILVMDLMRPETEQRVNDLVAVYTVDAPKVLRRDFRASLFAAYRPEEVREQLVAAQLAGLEVRVVSDRHLAVMGRLAKPDDARELGRS